MTIHFRTVFIILIISSILVAIFPLALGLGSTAYTYEGKCYGFTDGVWGCPWYEYAVMQIFYSGIFAIPFALTLFVGWLVTTGFWIAKRRTATPDRFPFWQAALIPMLGCVGGAILVSALPILINIYYELQHLYWKVFP